MFKLKFRDVLIFRFVFLIIILCLPGTAESIRLRGSWGSGQFYKFLIKFGFQKTDMHDTTTTQGYIFGNLSSNKPTNMDLSFVVVDSEYFIEFFGNTTFLPRTYACDRMFNRIDSIAWDRNCHQSGSEDFLRRMPCPKDQLCTDEDNPKMVIKGYQFTYRVQDTNQPRFWYVSMVACHRDNRTCQWLYNTDDIEIQYDIWMVNGNPSSKSFNPFEHQFSFEMHDIVEVYITFFVLYLILVPIQMYVFRKQQHTIPKLLTTCIVIEVTGIMCNCIHFVKFSLDGEGVPVLRIMGNLMNTVGPVLFMALLVLIAKGWTITVLDLSNTYKTVIVTFWTLFIITQISLFIWKQVENDLISAEDDWQTLPGYLQLLLSSLVIFWFLLELKTSFALEDDREKMAFYLHFGAGYLCYFIYMPILALICTQVSALWRYKTILSVSYGADFLAICCMVHILWPYKSLTSPILFSFYRVTRTRTVRGKVSSHRVEKEKLLEEDPSESENEVDITRRPQPNGRLRYTSDSDTAPPPPRIGRNDNTRKAREENGRLLRKQRLNSSEDESGL